MQLIVEPEAQSPSKSLGDPFIVSMRLLFLWQKYGECARSTLKKTLYIEKNTKR